MKIFEKIKKFAKTNLKNLKFCKFLYLKYLYKKFKLFYRIFQVEIRDSFLELGTIVMKFHNYSYEIVARTVIVNNFKNIKNNCYQIVKLLYSLLLKY